MWELGKHDHYVLVCLQVLACTLKKLKTKKKKQKMLQGVGGRLVMNSPLDTRLLHCINEGFCLENIQAL